MKLVVSGVLFAGAIACAGWGASIGLAKLAETTEGINAMEGSKDQVSPGIARSDGPLYLFIGKSVTASCDEVYDSIRVRFEANPWGPKPQPLDFNYNEFDGVDETAGTMALSKDCVKGSLGGVYSDVTVAATFVYAECKSADCGYDWFTFPWSEGMTWDFQYNITSSYGLSGIAGNLVRVATENTLGNLWDAAGNQFIGAIVCALLGIAACVLMPGNSGSDSPGTEMLS